MIIAWKDQYRPTGGMRIAFWPIWSEHCGYMRLSCLQNTLRSHVIISISWFNLYQFASSRVTETASMTWPCTKCFQNCFSVENSINLLLNTVIPISFMVRLLKVTWCITDELFIATPRLPPQDGGTLIFSYIRRLGPFLAVQNFEFQYFSGFSEKWIFWGYKDFVDIFGGSSKIGLYLGVISMDFRVYL